MARYFDLPIKLSHVQDVPLQGKLDHSQLQGEESDTHGDESSSESSSGPSDDEDGGEEAVKPPDFPHAPLKHDTTFSTRRLRKSQRNLKRRHFIALNTVLHRCVLDGDYSRAGRAFGLLLRFEIEGQRLDLRRKDLWGLGAEILMRRNTPKNPRSPLSGSGDGHASSEPSPDDSGSEWFTEKGFEDVKEYYERLILQYPYRKQRPNDVSARHFYPAMFDIWILHIQSKYQKALKAARPCLGPLNTSSVSDESMHEEPDSESQSQEQQQRVRQRQIGEVEALSERMDSLILRPPYDRDESILNLHRQVTQWLRDLHTDAAHFQHVHRAG